MAVEIEILSGARQGERLSFDGREIRVGADRNCQVAFDAARDPAIQGRSAVIQLRDDGWYLQATGGPVWINQQPVSQATRLRSGDIVRMSESGPEFSFRLLALAAAGAPWWTGPVDVPGGKGISGKGDRRLLPEGPSAGHQRKPSAGGQTPAAAANQPALGAPITAGAAPAENRPQAAQPARPADAGRWWPVWLFGAAALAILLLILVRAGFFSPPTIVVNLNSPGPAAAPSGSSPSPGGGLPPGSGLPPGGGLPSPGDAAPPAPAAIPAPAAAAGPAATGNGRPAAGPTGNSDLAAGEGRGEEPAPPPAAKEVEPATQDPGAEARARQRARLDGAVFLIEVEKQVGSAGHVASNFWPFATCVAVGDHVLLTTAREATQLAQWRQEKRFDKFWVARQSAGFKAEVADIRVAADYASLPDQTDNWIYVNLGLLTVGNRLPKVVPLASPEELAKLKGGSSVNLFGFSHEGEMIADDDVFEPRLKRLKVFLVTVADLPSRPRLLHVRGELPKNLYGSPVVNADGKLVGLYGEAAAPPGGEAADAAATMKDMHYITLIDTAAIDQALRDPASKAWVPPAVAPKPNRP